MLDGASVQDFLERLRLGNAPRRQGHPERESQTQGSSEKQPLLPKVSQPRDNAADLSDEMLIEIAAKYVSRVQGLVQAPRADGKGRLAGKHLSDTPVARDEEVIQLFRDSVCPDISLDRDATQCGWNEVDGVVFLLLQFRGVFSTR